MTEIMCKIVLKCQPHPPGVSELIRLVEGVIKGLASLVNPPHNEPASVKPPAWEGIFTDYLAGHLLQGLSLNPSPQEFSHWPFGRYGSYFTSVFFKIILRTDILSTSG